MAVTGSMEIVEIEAQIPIAQFRGPAHIDVGDDAKQITGTFSFANIVEQMGFNLTVRLGAGTDTNEWPNSFAQISDTIDIKTQIIDIIAAVDEVYSKAISGMPPPLTKCMFVEIEIRAKIIQTASSFHSLLFTKARYIF